MLWVNWILDTNDTCITTGPVEEVLPGEKVCWDRFTKQGLYFVKSAPEVSTDKCLSYSIKFHVVDGYFEYSFVLWNKSVVWLVEISVLRYYFLVTPGNENVETPKSTTASKFFEKKRSSNIVPGNFENFKLIMSAPTIGLISSKQPYIALKNWFRNAEQYARKHRELFDQSFNVRRKSSEIRAVTSIDTSLSQQLTSELLVER